MDNNNMNSDEYLFRDIESEGNTQISGYSASESTNGYEQKDDFDASVEQNNYYEQTDAHNQFVYTQPVEQDADYSHTTDGVESDKKETPKTKLGLISFILFICSGVVPAVLSKIGLNEFGTVLEGLSSIMGLAAFVLMIVTRAKYPKDIWGKVTMWLFIAAFVLSIILIIALIVACTSCANAF